MTGADSECRMVIASQTCESKGWVDENGREKCWGSLGGLAVEWANPLDDAKWFDKDNGFGTLWKTKSAQLLVSAMGGDGVGWWGVGGWGGWVFGAPFSTKGGTFAKGAGKLGDL